MALDAAQFVGSIPGNYDQWLVPHLFDGYADDLARRVLALQPRTVLELAAGTGILSRKLRDILASGTISGPERTSWGCMLELTWNGTEPLTLSDGAHRAFLDDGDVIEMRGWAGENQAVPLGSVRNHVVPALAH